LLDYETVALATWATPPCISRPILSDRAGIVGHPLDDSRCQFQ